MKSLIVFLLAFPIIVYCLQDSKSLKENVSGTEEAADEELNLPNDEALPKKAKPEQKSLRRVINDIFTGFRACHCKCGLPNGEEKGNGFLSMAQDITDNLSGSLGTGISGGIGGGLSGFLDGIFGGGATGGKKPIPKPKLLAGDYIDPNAMPWLAVVLVQGVFKAAGVLLSDRHVLTSASALTNTSTTSVKITLGLHERCGEDVASLNLSVSEILANPSFDPVSRAHDLALIKLVSVVTFNSQIRPICLPHFLSSPAGQQMTVAGWADDPTPGVVSCLPRRVRLPLLTSVECNRSVTSTEFNTPDKGCLGVVGSPGVICAGDVGSAVQYRGPKGNYELLGIITNVNACGAPNSTLFVKIQEHMSWIKLNLRNDCTCSKH